MIDTAFEPAPLDLPVIYAGQDWRFHLEWIDENDAPYDLTGCSAAMQVRSEDDATVYLELTTENGGIALGGTAGTIDLFVDKTDSRLIDWKIGKYDFWLTLSNGDSMPLFEGNLPARKPRTR
jgi:hypothetical protein